MAVCDEAWAINPDTVDDGMAPALAEPESAQLWIVSTAHVAATRLVPVNRAALLVEVGTDNPRAGLLLEWSARPELRSDDPEAWREASPYWTPKREAFVRDRLDKSVDEQSFRTQWLNVWPAVSRRRLVDVEAWARCATSGPFVPHAPLYGALEVARDGSGYGAALAYLDGDGVVRVWSRQSPRLLALTDWLLAPLVEVGGTLLVSVGLRGQLPLEGLPVTGIEVGMAELAGAVANTQALVAEGRLVHDGGTTLAKQVDGAAIVETDRGPHLSAARSTGSVEVVKAMLWTVQASTGHSFNTPAIF
jgi:phage terminase large subunit-like protein